MGKRGKQSWIAGHPDEVRLRELVDRVSIPMPADAAADGRNYRDLLKEDDLQWITGHPDAQTISLVLTRATNHPRRRGPKVNLGEDSPMYPSVFGILEFEPVPPPPLRKSKQIVYRSPSHQDAYLLFRTLCRLSTKSHTDPETGIVNPYTLCRLSTKSHTDP